MTASRSSSPRRSCSSPEAPWPRRSTTCCSGAGTSIDPKSGTSAVRDVAIAGGKIAAVAPKIDPAEAFKVVDVSGLYVTPGLVDMHVHVFAGTGEKGSYAGDNSVYPDGFTLRVGRHDRRRRGLLRLAQLRRLQGPRHRPLPHARPRLPQHRRQRHARREVRAGPRRHGGEADRRDGAPAQGPDRRDQDGPLRGARVGAGRAGGRGGHDRGRAGDGRLRREQARAAARRARRRRSSGRATSTPTCTRACAAS